MNPLPLHVHTQIPVGYTGLSLEVAEFGDKYRGQYDNLWYPHSRALAEGRVELGTRMHENLQNRFSKCICKWAQSHGDEWYGGRYRYSKRKK